MSTETSAADDAVRADIEARLDAVDRLLLGFIPRHERVAIMRSLEDRLRSIAANAPVARPLTQVASAGQRSAALGLPARDPLAALAAATASEELAVGWRRSAAPRVPKRRRSKLAVVSAILGIGAGGLLLGTPVAYFGLASFAEMVDETGAMIVGATYLGLTLLCGGAGIVAGLVALWRIRRRQPAIVGTGWAITGLCTAPIPFAAASVLTLVIGLQMLGSMQFSSVNMCSEPAPADAEGLPGPLPSPAPGPDSGPYAYNNGPESPNTASERSPFGGYPTVGNPQPAYFPVPSPTGIPTPMEDSAPKAIVDASAPPSSPAVPSATAAAVERSDEKRAPERSAEPAEPINEPEDSGT